jgi:hypothetical protein
VLVQFGGLWMWRLEAPAGTLKPQEQMLSETDMVRFTPPTTLKLSSGEVLAWNQGATRLRVVSGQVWITRRNDLVDHFLHHGQCFELRRSHGTLIQAEQEVWLRFERDRSIGWAPRFAAVVRAALGLIIPHGPRTHEGGARPL